MKSYFQKEIECKSRDEILSLQETLLKKQVMHAYNNIPYYKKKLDSIGISPLDIKTLDDINKLPFITKDDLKQAYPYGMFGTDLSDCVRIHSTSGTTGKRVIAGYTKHDIDLWEDCCARAIVAAGGSKNDILQISYGFGLFTGGAGINGGSHKVGCLTIPISSGNTDRQIQFMIDMGTTFLCCTPSYALYLAETINQQGLKNQIKLKYGIFGAEAWSEEMRKQIEELLNIKAYDIYGLTELSGPGVAYECEMQDGMHVNEDHFFVETINPETFKQVQYGEKGELVFTSLDKEAFPLIRYRTKDIGILNIGKCACGRTHVKMSKPMGRSDDMLIIKGVNVFPSQIEEVLGLLGCSLNYQIVIDRINNTDVAQLNVEVSTEDFTGSLSKINELQNNITNGIKSMLGIQIKVKLVSPNSIERSEGKAKRIIDKRKI